MEAIRSLCWVGIVVGEITIIVAMGIESDGHKHMLGLDAGGRKIRTS